MIQWVGAREDDLAFTVGLHRVGEDDHVLGVGRESDRRIIEALVGVDPEEPAPEISVVAAREECDLRVMGVRIAQPGGEPCAGLVERR